MKITEVMRAQPLGHPRPHLRVFASIDERSYEFTKLDADKPFEVYDFPADWGGVARFLGYMPEARAVELMEIVRLA